MIHNFDFDVILFDVKSHDHVIYSDKQNVPTVKEEKKNCLAYFP